jgi:hypothetical protein
MSDIEIKALRKDVSNKMKESSLRWKSVVKDLSGRLKGDVRNVVDIQAEAISHRQSVVEEINIYSVKIYKLVTKIKHLSKDRFEFYASSYQIKTSGAEKLKLIEADIADNQEFINELDEHVNLLRETAKQLESINYGVKNKIELANILGGFK